MHQRKREISLITLRAKLSGAMYCYRSCLWACLQRAGGVRTLLQPARAQCLRLTERFFHLQFLFGFKMSILLMIQLIQELIHVLDWSVLFDWTADTTALQTGDRL